jgi:hypothetical protein
MTFSLCFTRFLLGGPAFTLFMERAFVMNPTSLLFRTALLLLAMGAFVMGPYGASAKELKLSPLVHSVPSEGYALQALAPIPGLEDDDVPPSDRTPAVGHPDDANTAQRALLALKKKH